MGLFKNEVGRPSNETIRKRRIIATVIIFAVVLAIGGCVFYTVNTFKGVQGSGKNISSKNNNGKLYNSISIKNNSGAIYEGANKTNKGNFINGVSKKLEIELSSSNKASLTIRTTYNKDIIKGKLSGVKRYYYQVQIATYDKYDREISVSKKTDIKKSNIDQAITTGGTVTSIKVKFFNATKNHEELTSSRVMILVETLTSSKINNMQKSFPDIALRNCVLNHYNAGYETKNKDLTDSQLAEITGLERYYGAQKIVEALECKNVSNLTGLEKLKNLQSIELRDPVLTKADFSKNKKIKEISIVGNLKQINVTQNTELIKLYVVPYKIGDKGLTSINLTKNKKLKRLTLKYNSLKKINLTQNTNLEWVDLENNNLTSLDLSKNTKLKELYISENPIKKSNIKVSKGINLDKILKD